jgi:hypothetical protein
VAGTGNVVGGGTLAEPGIGSVCAAPCNVIHDNGGAGVAVVSGDANLVLANQIYANAGQPIDLGGDGHTPNDLPDADSGPNALVNFPFAVTAVTDPDSGEVTVTGTTPGQESDAGLVEVWAQPSAPGGKAAPRTFVGRAVLESDRAFTMKVPPAVAAANAFYTASVSTLQGTSELSPVCVDTSGDGKPDGDGDGICDAWEDAQGVDLDEDGTLDVALPGADKVRPDVYLEIDAMGGTSANGRPTAPTDDALDRVRTALASGPGGGVALHTDATERTLPRVAEVNPNGSGIALDGVKNGNPAVACDGVFGDPAQRAAADCRLKLLGREMFWRYALFASRIGADAAGANGIAEIHGMDVLIGNDIIGDGTDPTTHTPNWPQDEQVSGGFPVGCVSALDCKDANDAAVLMHELGHSLGLRHGGTENRNYKPNYFSIMNYSYAWATVIQDRKLDYSRVKVGDLDEQVLDEASGVAGPTADPAITQSFAWALYTFYDPALDICRFAKVRPGQAADFDFDTVLDPPGPDATRIWVPDGDPDPNGPEDCQSFPRTKLTGARDWDRLRPEFRSSEQYLGGSGYFAHSELTDAEPTYREVRRIDDTFDGDGDGITNAQASCVAMGRPLLDGDGDGRDDRCFGVRASNGGGGGGGGGGQPPSGPPAAPQPARDRTAPKLTRLKLAGKTLKRRRRTTVSFMIDEAATVTFKVARKVSGRRKGKTCLAGRRTGVRCTALKAVKGSFSARAAKAGSVKVTFTGKLAGKALSRGSYVLQATARDAAGNAAKPVTVTFAVR